MLIQQSNITFDGQNIVIQVPEQWATILAIIVAAIIGACLSSFVAWLILHKERELRLLDKKYDTYFELIEWGRNTLWSFERIESVLNLFAQKERNEKGEFDADIAIGVLNTVKETLDNLEEFYDKRPLEKRLNDDPQNILDRLMPSGEELRVEYGIFSFTSKNLKNDLHKFKSQIHVKTEKEVLEKMLVRLERDNHLLREKIEAITVLAQEELRIPIKPKL